VSGAPARHPPTVRASRRRRSRSRSAARGR
jgi:hypothetical protein